MSSKILNDPPLCASCGRWWRGDSESCYIDHSQDYETYRDRIEALEASERKSRNEEGAPRPSASNPWGGLTWRH